MIFRFWNVVHHVQHERFGPSNVSDRSCTNGQKSSWNGDRLEMFEPERSSALKRKLKNVPVWPRYVHVHVEKLKDLSPLCSSKRLQNFGKDYIYSVSSVGFKAWTWSVSDRLFCAVRTFRLSNIPDRLSFLNVLERPTFLNVSWTLHGFSGNKKVTNGSKRSKTLKEHLGIFRNV